MIEIEDIVEPEWAEWYRMTPQERWRESEKLWATFIALGGSLEPEPDTQSPFFDPDAPTPAPSAGRLHLHVTRRLRVIDRCED
jgi:hypothetical protein